VNFDPPYYGGKQAQALAQAVARCRVYSHAHAAAAARVARNRKWFVAGLAVATLGCAAACYPVPHGGKVAAAGLAFVGLVFPWAVASVCDAEVESRRIMKRYWAEQAEHYQRAMQQLGDRQ